MAEPIDYFFKGIEAADAVKSRAQDYQANQQKIDITAQAQADDAQQRSIVRSYWNQSPDDQTQGAQTPPPPGQSAPAGPAGIPGAPAQAQPRPQPQQPAVDPAMVQLFSDQQSAQAHQAQSDSAFQTQYSAAQNNLKKFTGISNTLFAAGNVSGGDWAAKQAKEAQSRITDLQSQRSAADSARWTQLSDIFAGVKDQPSLNAALAIASQKGLALPPNTPGVYDKDTAKYFGGIAAQGITAKDQAGIAQKAQDLQRKDQEESFNESYKAEELQQKDRALQVERERIDATERRASDRGGERVSATAERFNNRVISAGEQVASDLENISNMKVGMNGGLLGVFHSKSSLLGATGGLLVNKLSGEDARDFRTAALGLERNLATLETQGLAPPGSFTKQLEGSLPMAGDSVENTMRKMATMRQIAENSLKTVGNSKSATPETKVQIEELRDRLSKAVPYTVADVEKWKRSLKTNPGQTLGDYVDQQKLGQQTGRPPLDSFDPSKGGGKPTLDSFYTH